MAETKMMDFTVKTKDVQIVDSVPGVYDCRFSYLDLYCYCIFLPNYILFYGADYIWLLICDINYLFIFHARFSYSYYC